MNHTMFVALAWSINQNSTMIMAQALVFLIPAVVPSWPVPYENP